MYIIGSEGDHMHTIILLIIPQVNFQYKTSIDGKRILNTTNGLAAAKIVTS